MNGIARKSHWGIVGSLAALLLAGCHGKPGVDDAATGGRVAGSAPGGMATGGTVGGTLKYFYPEAPRGGKGNSYAHVTYATNVHELEKSDGLDGLEAESTDGRALLYKASTPGIASLKAGDILIIKGVAARKILKVEQKGDEVYLAVDVASLREVVANGEIKLDAPVHFGKVTNGGLTAAPGSIFDLFATPAYAQSFSPDNNAAAAASSSAATGATIDGFGNMMKGLGKFAVGDWTVTQYNASPSNGQLNLDLVLAKSVGGFKAMIAGHGYITDFDLIQNMQLGSNFASTQLVSAFKNVGGQMKLTWEIGKDTPGGYAKEDRMKLPISASIPLAQYLGGLPVMLEISAAMIIHPALTGGSEIATGAYTINYNGSMEGNAVQSGTTASGDFKGNATLDQDAGASGIAPVGMVVAYCFPRLELSLGLSKIYPALSPDGAAGKVLNAAVGKVDSWLSSVTSGLPATSGISTTAIISNALTSNAAVFAQLVSTAGVTRSGDATVAPCSNVDLHVTGQVGVNANMFGVGIDENKHTSDVFTKSFSRNTGGMCASIGK